MWYMSSRETVFRLRFGSEKPEKRERKRISNLLLTVLKECYKMLAVRKTEC